MKLKIIGLVVVILLIGFGFYAYAYNSLALEGNHIFDERCNKVNPLFIAVQNDYLAFMDYSSGRKQGTADDVAGSLDNYQQSIAAYLPAEKHWLDLENSYINRWDFKLLEPNYIKTPSDYQLKMYQSYYQGYSDVLKVFSGQITGDDMMKTIAADNQERDQYTQKYFTSFTVGQQLFDPRKWLVHLPPTTCPPENFNIPDTSHAADTPTPVPTPDKNYLPPAPHS